MQMRHPVGAALVAGSIAAAVALPGCSSSPDPDGQAGPAAGTSTAAPAEAGPPPVLASATLEDGVVALRAGQVGWTTTWRACAAPDPADPAEVVGWQSQALTPEGSSPEVEELARGCLDLDVATGVNAEDAGLVGRDAQLADAANLAYRVRAVHADGTVTPWSVPYRVGTARPG